MAAKRTSKELTVKGSTYLTKHMLRLTLHGEALSNFPSDVEGAYFKFAFENTASNKPTMRTYTIANFRRDTREIDVDFMLHGGGVDGIAVAWATQAKEGDTISIFGPGPASFVNLKADWFLLAADMTALPALTANLATLPQDAAGYVVIEILSEEDKQDLHKPENVNLLWVINPQAGSDASPLFDAVTQLEWLNGQVAIWTACEFKTMKKISQY